MSAAACFLELRTPFAHLMPPLTEQERTALEASLREHGQLHEILIDEQGAILDGHNRYQILGSSVRVRVVSGLSETEKKAFVYRHGVARRNMTDAQKDAVRLLMKTVAFELKREDPHKNTQQRIADKLGVARETVRDWFRETIHNGGAANRNSGRRSLDGRVRHDEARKAEAVRRVEAGEPQTAVAAALGMAQPTVSKLVAKASVEPAGAEQTATTDPAPVTKPQRNKPPPRVDHEKRRLDVLELHNQGFGTTEIGKRLGLGKMTVSNIKSALGIGENSPSVKLWSEIDHVTTTLEGAALKVEQLTEALATTVPIAGPEEIKRCIQSLSETLSKLRGLRSALKGLLK